VEHRVVLFFRLFFVSPSQAGFQSPGGLAEKKGCIRATLLAGPLSLASRVNERPAPARKRRTSEANALHGA
jgi:hypothetical protein